MRVLTKSVLGDLNRNIERIPACEAFGIFFEDIMKTDSCGLDIEDIKRLERKAFHKKQEDDILEDSFLRMLAARCYELCGDYFEAAMIYDRAAKSAGILASSDSSEFGRYRGRILELSANCHMKSNSGPGKKFENAGYAFLKAARCFPDERLETFRMLKRSEMGFFCAGKNIENIGLFMEILSEAGMGDFVIDYDFIRQTPELKIKNNMPVGSPNGLEIAVSIAMFADGHSIRENDIRSRLKQCRSRAERIFLAAAYARMLEIGKRWPIAGENYFNAADLSSVSNIKVLASELFLRAGKVYLMGRAWTDASKSILKSSECAKEDELREQLRICAGEIEKGPSVYLAKFQEKR